MTCYFDEAYFSPTYFDVCTTPTAGGSPRKTLRFIAQPPETSNASQIAEEDALMLLEIT